MLNMFFFYNAKAFDQHIIVKGDWLALITFDDKTLVSQSKEW